MSLIKYLLVGFPQRINIHPDLGQGFSLLQQRADPRKVLESLLKQTEGLWLGGDGGRQWLMNKASVHVYIPIYENWKSDESSADLLDLVNVMHPTLSIEYARLRDRYDTEFAVRI
jgi:hypothetical protein